MSRMNEAISEETIGVTTFIPSDYLLGQLETLCGLLGPLTKQERQRRLKPGLRRLNAWERSTLIGTLRFLIASVSKDAQEQKGKV